MGKVLKENPTICAFLTPNSSPPPVQVLFKKVSRNSSWGTDTDNWSQIFIGGTQRDLLFSPTQLSHSHPATDLLCIFSPAGSTRTRPRTRTLSLAQWRPRMHPLLLTLTLRPFLYHPVDLSTSEDCPELLFVHPLISWEPSIRDPRVRFGDAPVGRIAIRSVTVGDEGRVDLIIFVVTSLMKRPPTIFATFGMLLSVFLFLEELWSRYLTAIFRSSRPHLKLSVHLLD